MDCGGSNNSTVEVPTYQTENPFTGGEIGKGGYSAQKENKVNFRKHKKLPKSINNCLDELSISLKLAKTKSFH